MTEIQGQCDDGFGSVHDVFAANFDNGSELGAAFSVVQNGKCVIDLWGGFRDNNKSSPWTRDTLANVWSTTKGPTAMCCAHLADQNKLRYSDTVASHWPEFAAAGKDKITVGQLLSHQAGLSGLREPTAPEDFYDQKLMATRLAAQEPLWAPGAFSGYHAITYGFLAAELVQRISGKTLGTYFRDEIAEPFGIDFHIGLAASNEDRIAEMVESDGPATSLEEISDTEIKKLTFTNPLLSPLYPNERAWREAEIPAAGGRASAHAIAKLYGILATGGSKDGKQLLSLDGIKAMATPQIENEDAVLGMPTRWGAGMALNAEWGEYGPNMSAFGHSGWGGSFGSADLETGLGVSYVMNKMGGALAGDPRALALTKAVYTCL